MDSRKRKPPDWGGFEREARAQACWGQILGDATGCPPVEASSRKLFKQRFCDLCRNGGLTVPAARLRIVGNGSSAVANDKSGGAWNMRRDTSLWPEHRVINQNAVPTMVLLRKRSLEELPGLLPYPCAPSEVVRLLVGAQTLRPAAVPALASPPSTSPQQRGGLTADGSVWSWGHGGQG